jgi:hypothetical protein
LELFERRIKMGGTELLGVKCIIIIVFKMVISGEAHWSREEFPGRFSLVRHSGGNIQIHEQGWGCSSALGHLPPCHYKKTKKHKQFSNQ